MVCRECGKELPKNYTTDICLDCSRENVRKIFKENPDIKQAFKESIEEMKKPENMKTVSYTHLDVYKRQIQMLPEIWQLSEQDWKKNAG